MKISADVSLMPASLEEAALMEQHKTATEQRRSARKNRASAQKDAIEKRKAAASKLHEMAEKTIQSSLFQAGVQFATAACSAVQLGQQAQTAELKGELQKLDQQQQQLSQQLKTPPAPGVAKSLKDIQAKRQQLQQTLAGLSVQGSAVGVSKDLLGVAARLDVAQWEKDELQAEKADIEIAQQRADAEAQRASEEVGEARERESKIQRQLEDMNRIRHETRMATIRR
ncbi:MAG: hypothetical protein CSA65_01320 [Proteobacteria bacterium]|nr:MAG: hypothetical protein CSA65_01320 [Pseudomonadota bacterium]